MSDVLIKGMKMPPKGEYSATINVHGDGKAYIDFDDVREMSAYTVLFAQCELVEVPPHGRLIDADECHKYFYDHLDDLHMEIAEIAIEEMPTIIEAEDKDINVLGKEEDET